MKNYTVWVRYALIFSVFCIPFIPFIISSDWYFPFITGKNFTFRIITEIGFALLLLLVLKDPLYRPKDSWVSRSVLALLCVAILSTIFSVDPNKSFWSNFERMEGLVGFLHLTMWFFIVSTVLSTEKLWERFLQVSIGASVIMGGYVLMQVNGFLTINQGGVRADGTFGNAIYLAVYMLFHIFFTLFVALRHRGQSWMYWLYGVAILLQTIALYYAATRSATLGLLGGLLVAGGGIALFDREHKVLRKGAIGVVIAVAVVVVFFLAVKNMPWVQNNAVLNRFASISTQETTIKSRFMIWNMARQGVVEHPVLGWGFENFSFVFNKYYDPEMWGQEQWFDRAHNAFIDWAVAGGILGLLGFIALFVAAGFALWQADTLAVAERSVLIGLLAAYGFHSFFVFDNLMSSVYFFVFLALAHYVGRKNPPRMMFLTRPMSDGAFAIVAPIVIVGIAAGGYFLNAPGMATAGTLIDALTPTKTVVENGANTTKQKDPMENLASFSAATESSSLGRQEAIEQLLQISSSAATASGIDPAVRDAYVRLATERGAALLVQRPNDARLELFYGSFLTLAGKQDEGLKHLKLAHELSPHKQTISFELGVNAYLRAGDIANALTTLKGAYDLAPEYPEAAKYYAMALMYAGKITEADAVLTKSFGSPIVDDDRILGVYTDAKQFDRVAAIWKMRSEKNPTDAQARAYLASAYKEGGNPGAAAATLKKAIQDLPQYTAQFTQVAGQLGVSVQ